MQRKKDYSFIYLNLSALFIEYKEYEKSIAILDKAIKNVSPPKSSLYYNRACSYMKLNQKEKALEDLKKSVDLNRDIIDYAKNDPDFDEIKNDEEFIEIIGV